MAIGRLGLAAGYARRLRSTLSRSGADISCHCVRPLSKSQPNPPTLAVDRPIRDTNKNAATHRIILRTTVKAHSVYCFQIQESHVPSIRPLNNAQAIKARGEM